MAEEKFNELLKEQPDRGAVDETHRTPVTILFSDIKGSTAYFEKHGDIKGMAMVERHNDLLFPCVRSNRGRIVKTIGDAIMALFDDPVHAVTAAADMQKALASDNSGRDAGEKILVRIGVHTGLGLLRDNDVFGDVVNSAARVQSQALPDQILITDSLLSAAATAGFQVGKIGRARMKGKDEPIDVYAVGWSPDATQHLIDDLQSKHEEALHEAKRSRLEVEEQLDQARDQWRDERRRLNREVEKLEEGSVEALESERAQLTEDLGKQAQFKLEAAEQSREQVEADFKSARERFEVERVGYRTQTSSLETRVVESMEQANNPARAATQLREQLQKRLGEAKKDWQSQWDVERKRLTDEIDRVKNAGPQDPMAEARKLMMERIKAKQEGRSPGDGPDYKAEKEQVEKERDRLQIEVGNLEKEVLRTREAARQEASDELRVRYDQKAEQADRLRVQIEHEISNLRGELSAEKKSSASRVQQLEESITDSEEAARSQASTEVRSELESRLDESDRNRLRLERRYQDSQEEWELDRSRLEKQIKELESHVQQARDMAFKRSSHPTVEELNRLRRQLEEEFQMKTARLEEEKKHLIEKIHSLENPPGVDGG
jgi:class 3 adenylate cyclase